MATIVTCDRCQCTLTPPTIGNHIAIGAVASVMQTMMMVQMASPTMDLCDHCLKVVVDSVRQIVFEHGAVFP